MELPDCLRTTIVTVLGMGEASAGEVASKTGRSRSLESYYLNRLVRLGHLRKVRRGRRVYFRSMYVRRSVSWLVERLGLEIV